MPEYQDVVKKILAFESKMWVSLSAALGWFPLTQLGHEEVNYLNVKKWVILIGLFI